MITIMKNSHFQRKKRKSLSFSYMRNIHSWLDPAQVKTVKQNRYLRSKISVQNLTNLFLVLSCDHRRLSANVTPNSLL